VACGGNHTLAVCAHDTVQQEREEKKKVLAGKEEEKVDGKGMGKEKKEVEVSAEEQQVGAADAKVEKEAETNGDHISEPSDTSDVRRMKESKFVWADDEE
ncbi:MAG: hypothetical protein Q9228_008006, partial [Teloschistes exilis]